MLFWLVMVIVGLTLLFTFVVFVGPPYLQTTRQQIDTALDLLDLREGQTLLELGSGDGRVMRAAAKRGLRVVGIELNPVLVIISFFVTWRYRKQIRIIWGSYWGAPWPKADGIFTFLLPKYMQRLDARIVSWHTQPIRLASFAFKIQGRQPARYERGIYLYDYN